MKWIACLMTGLIVAGTAWAQDTTTIQAAHKSVTLSGYSRSRTKQTLAAEVTGKVLLVHYDVGDTVGRKPFIEIDPTFVDFQIEKAQWTLENLAVARARGASRLAYLQKEFQRIDALHQSDVATLSRWEAAAEEMEQARLTLQTSDVELKSLKTQIKELKERRERHKVFAPQGWVIVQRRVEPGEIITAGTPLAQVADFTRLVIPLFVSGKELAAVQQADPLLIQVEGRPVRAALNWINPEFDERTRKLAIELSFVDYTGQARGGLLAELTLQVPADGLMVPKASVTNRYDNPYVVLKTDARKVPVSILGENGDYLLIAEHAVLRAGMELHVRRDAP